MDYHKSASRILTSASTLSSGRDHCTLSKCEPPPNTYNSPRHQMSSRTLASKRLRNPSSPPIGTQVSDYSRPAITKIPQLSLLARQNRLVLWACIGALISTALSIILFARDVYLGSNRVPLQSTNGRALRRPSQYMNLDKVLANSTYTFPPITNFPPVTFQMKVGDSRRRMREDERGRPTKLGAVYPDDRHILINSEVTNHSYPRPYPTLTVYHPTVSDNRSIPKH